MNRTWPVLLPIALLPLLFHWMPLWRRNGIWFSVTVAPGYTDGPEARTVLHRFRVAIWLLAVVALLAVALIAVVPAVASPETLPWAFLAGMTLEIGGALAALADARRRTLPHAVPPGSRSASLIVEPESLPGGMVAVLVPYVILGAAALYLAVNWDLIPQRLPVHWDISGTIDGWAERGWFRVFAPLLLGAVHVGFMFLIALGILHASPRGRVAANANASAQFRRVMLQFLVAVTWGMALVLAAAALAPRSAKSLGTLPVVLTVGLVALAIPFLRRLIRVIRSMGSGGDGTPDECWKLGIFYFNPADPAIFVVKRLGIGYTCNFGNRTTWLLLGLIVVISLVPILVKNL